MRKLSFLSATLNLIISTLLNILNYVLAFLYMCLPLWFFMVIMQLRDKNNKATAISTFVKDNSEFQYIFPGYILVAVDPTSLRKWHKNFMRIVYDYLNTNKWLLIISLLIIIATAVCVNVFN